MRIELLLSHVLDLRKERAEQQKSHIAASFVPKWRATADEDAHYCFAVAL
jgi:hypothetical protein